MYDHFIHPLFEKLNPAIMKQIYMNWLFRTSNIDRLGVQKSFTITANGLLLNTLQNNYMVELILKCIPLKVGTVFETAKCLK